MEQTLQKIFQATGSRKTSIAKVIIKPGSGKIKINNRTLEEYFSNHQLQQNLVISPLVLTGLKDKLDINVDVKGGGITGQADAIKLAIARALVMYDPQLKNTLKKAGMLRRDPRMVERKKAGKPKARKSFQWTKR